MPRGEARNEQGGAGRNVTPRRDKRDRIKREPGLRHRGNSSRTIAALQDKGIKTVFLDLTRFGGQNVTPEQWYLGLRSEFLAYWKANAEFSFVQRFFGALGEVALEKLTEPIVVFVDEIDAALLEEEGKPFGSQTPLSTLAFSPDKARFVTGGTDQIVRLWDAPFNPHRLRCLS